MSDANVNYVHNEWDFGPTVDGKLSFWYYSQFGSRYTTFVTTSSARIVAGQW